jgi:hypothetical protein
MLPKLFVSASIRQCMCEIACCVSTMSLVHTIALVVRVRDSLRYRAALCSCSTP